IAVGSRGDVQPCVALAVGLVNAGYAVRIVTMESFEEMVREHGLEYLPIEGDAQMLTTDLLQSSSEKSGNLLAMYRGMMRTFGAITDSYYQAFINSELRDSNAILCQLPAGFYGYDLAEALGVPYIALSVIPQEVTSAWPLSLFPSRMSLGPIYNRLTYRMAQQMVWHPFRKPINKFRKALGLPPTSFWWGNIRRMTQKRVPVIQGFSEDVIPHQAEWGDHVFTTGYWLLDEADWQPSPELVAFLAAGDAPIYIGFGSMPVPDPEATTQLIVDALQETNQRGIVNAGWAKLGASDLPDTIFLLDYAPFRWLFPQMKAIVHHGGSGTTGLALQSGRPSLVVPFTADQPFWGQRTQQLGAGPAAIPFSKLTRDKLVTAIRQMIDNPSIEAQAQALRNQMIDEDGVQRAVEIISAYLTPPRS
ncbi:MAG: glycosyltransferase family 1 protein, partial [Anaerolineae bacterium]|nr:glycosyltransferase family 1 protein [Anaerolineae bacterium]